MIPKQEIKLPINYTNTDPQTRKLVREIYVQKQNGLCQHCNLPLTELPVESIRKYPINASLFPKTMFIYPIHLHHSRVTGLTIGAVHAHCNAYLWQYKGE